MDKVVSSSLTRDVVECKEIYMSVRYYLIPVVTPEEQVVLDKFGLEALPIRLGTLVPHKPFMFDLIEGSPIGLYSTHYQGYPLMP